MNILLGTRIMALQVSSYLAVFKLTFLFDISKHIKQKNHLIKNCLISSYATATVMT